MSSALKLAPRTTVTTATTADIPYLTRVLARAFADDPVVQWFALQDERRTERVQRLFDWYLRDIVPHGVSTTTASLDGAALWCPPDRWCMPLWRQALLLPTIVGITGSRNAPSRIAGVDLLTRKHPRTPHYYLAIVGVDPAHRGEGLGSALLEPALDRCDATGTPAYLENTKGDNLPFYEAKGFRVIDEITMPRGPRQWLMWREPEGRRGPRRVR